MELWIRFCKKVLVRGKKVTRRVVLYREKLMNE